MADDRTPPRGFTVYVCPEHPLEADVRNNWCREAVVPPHPEIEASARRLVALVDGCVSLTAKPIGSALEIRRELEVLRSALSARASSSSPHGEDG